LPEQQVKKRHFNAEKFQISITEELLTVENRVRHLIDDANWGDEGRYKEAILRNVIKRFLPSNLSIGSGFIVKVEHDGIHPEHEVSKQIDIIIYDNTVPVLFSEGDFLITTPNNVRAIIEVKTSLDSTKLKKSIENAKHNAKLIENGNVFTGLFVFEKCKSSVLGKLKKLLPSLVTEGKTLRCLAVGPYYFIKHWQPGEHDSYPCSYPSYRFYDFNQHDNKKMISFSYFISNIMADLIPEKSITDRFWFLFPIEGGKEQFRIHEIKLDRNESDDNLRELKPNENH